MSAPQSASHLTRRALQAALCIIVAMLASAPLAQAVKGRVSLPQIETKVMCVTCKIPLMVAESPQANVEREFIKSLIEQGDDEAQIKRALVSQYGASVLGLPAASGFDLTVYLVPIAVVLALVALLVVLLPRWRRRAREQAARRAVPSPTLEPLDAERLDRDLARFER